MIDETFGNWFSGFTAGEGYFKIGREKINGKFYYRCQFVIALRADDKPALERIRDTIGFGTVYERPRRPESNTQESVTLHVHSIRDCNRLINPIRSKKQQEFEIWKRAVKELQKHPNYRNSNALNYYFLRIRELRKYAELDKIIEPPFKELQLIIRF